MNMQGYILMALREQFTRWEEVLASLSEEQIIAPHLPSLWSIKDEIVHLRAWQQRSIARLEAAALGRAPVFPPWPAEVDPDSQDGPDRTNAWIFETYREQPWAQVYPNWREGFLRFLELGAAISEKDLLDAGRYPWLEGYPLVFILLASYDHHQAHLDGLLAWLRRPRVQG
ncbi:MAG: ClbS/DfsB family four-helix bundle protein [Anaerolineae bacterium]